jgi:hypothetical protein
MFSYFIFQDNQIKKVLRNQASDVNVYGTMHKLTSCSVQHALTYEGYKIEVLNHENNKVVDYLTEKVIAKPQCIMQDLFGTFADPFPETSEKV